MTDPLDTSALWRRAAWGCAASAILALIGFGSLRVAELERSERAIESELESLATRMQAPHATRISARLGEAHLLADQNALFELCAASDLRALRGAFELVVLNIEATQVMLRVPLDDAHLAHVKGDAAFSCLVVGSGLIEHSGDYSVEAVWQDAPPTAASVLDAKLALRILAKPQLRALDVALVAALGGALLLVVLGLFLSAKPLPEAVAPPSSAAYALLAPCVGLAVVYACMQWPTASALFTLFKGELMLALQVGLAFLLASAARPAITAAAAGPAPQAPRLPASASSITAAAAGPAPQAPRLPASASVRALLGLGPARRTSALAGALLAWPCLVAAAKLSLRLVPSTGEAPIQTFISWPSGMFSAALLGVLLPVGEELFFRGYVFGSLLRFGKPAAAVSSIVAFGLLHAEQSWGNWGGLVAVFVSGAAMCALRMLTGSTWIAALCHLAYNLTLSLGSMLAARA